MTISELALACVRSNIGASFGAVIDTRHTGTTESKPYVVQHEMLPRSPREAESLGVDLARLIVRYNLYCAFSRFCAMLMASSILHDLFPSSTPA